MTIRGAGSYLDDQRYAIGGICDIAEKEQVDGILLAGDIFDRSIASPEAVKLYDEVMTHICADLGIRVYLIAGNHDSAERISQCRDLLKKSGLFIAGALTKEVQVVQEGDTDIYLLPWISTDKVRSFFPDKADCIDSMEDAYRTVLDLYRERFIPGHRNILVSHAFIVNAETSVSDRAAEIGSASMVGSSVFDGFDYVALGHLHAPQDITETIRYSGSLMAYSFGKEEKQEKSVTIIDTDDMSRKVIPVPQLRKRTTLKGTYGELLQAEQEKEILEGYVRLEVTDSFVGLEAAAALKEKYDNLLEIAGKSLERDDAGITMSMDEFDEVSSDPESVFRRYCEDTMGEEPDGRLMGLFRSALSRFEREITAG